MVPCVMDILGKWNQSEIAWQGCHYLELSQLCKMSYFFGYGLCLILFLHSCCCMYGMTELISHCCKFAWGFFFPFTFYFWDAYKSSTLLSFWELARSCLANGML